MDTLDQIAQESADTPVKPHVIAFVGAKHGVGKTSVVANLAAALVARGKRVCIFDVDTGLSNINGLLGLRPQTRLEQVANGEKTIAEVLLKTSEDIGVVPAANGVRISSQSSAQMTLLNHALSDLEAQFDYFFIDVPSTLTDTALRYIELTKSTFLIVSSEPTTLTDGFAWLKALHTRHYAGHLRVVVNQALDYPAAADTYRRFAAVADKCLKLKVDYGGFVVRDENLPKSLALQISVLELAVNSPASRCCLALADNIIKHIGAEQAVTGLPEYWQAVISADESRGVEVIQADIQATEAPMPETTTAHPALSIGALGAQMLAAMNSQLLDQPDLERFTADFVEAYCAHFGRFPTAFKSLFYRWLESENYAEPRLLELVSTLEALHALRYQRPLYGVEENAARLVAQLHGQQEHHRGLVEQLATAYRQAFHEDVFDPELALLARIQGADFTEQDFEVLLENLRNGFQARFKRPYQSRHEITLAAAVEAMQAMSVDQQNLEDEATMLIHGLQSLGSRCTKLLSALNKQQASDVPLVSGNTGAELAPATSSGADTDINASLI